MDYKRKHNETSLLQELSAFSHEKMTGEVVIYNPDDSIRLEVLLDKGTVWLTLKQLSQLFDRDRTVIGRHISNIFKEGELNPDSVCANFAHTEDYGRVKGLTQTRNVIFYNLDVIISVGYRVKSIRGTQFRQWANKVLKSYHIGASLKDLGKKWFAFSMIKEFSAHDLLSRM